VLHIRSKMFFVMDKTTVRRFKNNDIKNLQKNKLQIDDLFKISDI
jgi:hypothetical protein